MYSTKYYGRIGRIRLRIEALSASRPWCGFWRRNLLLLELSQTPHLPLEDKGTKGGNDSYRQVNMIVAEIQNRWKAAGAADPSREVIGGSQSHPLAAHVAAVAKLHTLTTDCDFSARV